MSVAIKPRNEHVVITRIMSCSAESMKRRKRHATPKWCKTILPFLAHRCESVLFQQADSREGYGNVLTLEARVSDLSNQHYRARRVAASKAAGRTIG